MSPLLVVVNGPIASGKSTLAQALGRELRERGRRAAVIDLDLLYDMLDHRPKSDEALWLLARQASALLAERFWAAGIDAVVVEGSFSDAPKRAALLEGLTTEVKPRIVTLRVSFAAELADSLLDRHGPDG